MEIKITINDDKKCKEQSFEATAIFDYIWDNSWNGYGGEFTMTAFGKNEIEARERLKDELFRFHSELTKGLSLANLLK